MFPHFTLAAEMTLGKELRRTIKNLNLKVYERGNKRIETMDVNGDNIVDARMEYINGKLYKEELDLNFDGKFDEVEWNYQQGNKIRVKTIDKNFDGKVDKKIVETTSGAKNNFFFIQKIYKDNDYDGVFDVKSKREIPFHQRMNQGIPQAQILLGNQNGQDVIFRSMTCGESDYARMHLPGILDEKQTEQLNSLMRIVGERSYNKSLLGDGRIQFRLEIQNSCLLEGSEQDRSLFQEGNILESLKNGLSCLGGFVGAGNYNANTKAASNFRKALAGLNRKHITVNDNKQEEINKVDRLHLVCKLPDHLEQSWTENLDGNEVEAFAMATTSYLEERNKFSEVAKVPNIVFRPGLFQELSGNSWPREWPNQNAKDKFQELVFHEYLHTALGTRHKANEIDFAEACGDACFNKPSDSPVSTKIRTTAMEICSGTLNDIQDPRYREYIQLKNR